MNKHKKLMGLLSGLLLYVLSTSIVNALIITEFVQYDMNLVTPGVTGGYSKNIATPSLDPFDSTLGQLDAVEISITGNIIMNMSTGLSYFVGGSGGTTFMPYSIYTDVNLGFNGLTDFFNASPDLGGMHINTAIGSGGAAANLASYNLGFRIDEASELVGSYLLPDSFGYSGGAISSVPLVFGERNDFIDSLINTDLLNLSLEVSFFTVGGVPLTPTVINTKSFGTIQVDYHYIPSGSIVDPPQEVSEPNIVWLLGLGLALIGFVRKTKS